MNHDLNHIKYDYQNIKIPENLKAQVETAIAQAKEDMEKETISSKTNQKKFSVLRFWLTRGTIGIAAALFVLTILVNSNATISYAMEQIPFLGAIVKIVTFREYKHHENRMEATIKTPEIQIENKNGEVLEDASQKLNDKIQDYTNKIIAAYEADVKTSNGEGTEAINLDYEIVTDNDSLFSICFHQTITMAGAEQSEKIYHIEKATGNLITMKDLFQENTDYKSTISQNIKEQMKEQMKEDDTKTYWLDNEISECNFTEISDSVNFYINESGKLVIVFDEYEVAPGYMGIVSFEIPTDVVSTIVKNGYLK